jgi:hypothetical protein
MQGIQCNYKNEEFNVEWKADGNKINDGNFDERNNFLNFSKEQTTLIDCDQNNVECVKSEVTILNFERSTENAIEIVLNFAVVKAAIGKR